VTTHVPVPATATTSIVPFPAISTNTTAVPAVLPGFATTSGSSTTVSSVSTVCAQEGQQFSKVYPNLPGSWCDGLTEWNSGMDTRQVVDAKCIATGLMAGSPVGTCIKCGDGVCGRSENICNCPQDCGAQKTCYNEGEGIVGYPATPTLSCCPGLVAASRTTCTGDSCATTEGFICKKPAPVCGNGKCETGETIANCSSDCPSITDTDKFKCSANSDCIATCGYGCVAKTWYTSSNRIDCMAMPIYNCSCLGGTCQKNTNTSCQAESKFCGGIATGAFPCCDGLVCKLNGTYPDAGGTCVKKNPATPVCGNSICEADEADFCPACTKSVPACMIACTKGTCSQDCQQTVEPCPAISQPSPEFCKNGTVAAQKNASGCVISYLCVKTTTFGKTDTAAVQAQIASLRQQIQQLLAQLQTLLKSK
jgi:hypothetical protein